MLKLYTIGYEGTDLARVIEVLDEHGVKLVADIRERPQSRKPGFSKNVFQKALALKQIDYRHFRDLGDPKDGRTAARSGNYPLFRNIYARQLATAKAMEQLQALTSTARAQATCLLCFEKEPVECHRMIVADCLAEEGFVTVNLFTDRNPVEYGDFRKQSSRDTRQGAAAT
jgi:uncharacterized protein (DUF488 family)